MAARQLRRILFFELLGYVLLGFWLVQRAGWSAGDAARLAVAWALCGRLLFVLATFAITRSATGPVPPELRLGPLDALRMVLAEYVALLAMFTVVQPFERFWMGPDRLAHCGARRLPVLLIHGYQCNRGFWFWLRRRLEGAGWTVATHNLEPVYADIDSYADGVARRVDEVLAATGARQLLLVAHSMGGLASRAYLRRHGAGKVARLVTLGSPHHGTTLARFGLGTNARQMQSGSAWLEGLAAGDRIPPGSVSIFSHHDNYVAPQEAGSTLDSLRPVALGGVSHIAMAISPMLLAALCAALEEPAPGSAG